MAIATRRQLREVLSIRVDAELLNKIDRVSKITGKTRSQIAREALEKYMSKFLD